MPLTPIDWNSWESSGSEMALPALPFPPGQVFLPGESKRLHLFEARYLALFEATVTRYDSRFAHVLIDTQRRAMAAVGALLSVRVWQRLDVGVCITVDAIGRLHTARLHPSAPFLTADFARVCDNKPLDEDIDVLYKLDIRFWSALRTIASCAHVTGIPILREKIDTASSTLEAIRLAGGSVPSFATDSLDSSTSINSNENSVNNTVQGTSERDTVCAVEGHIRQAAERAVGYARIDWSDDCKDKHNMVRRAQGLSFAAWDVFPCTAQQRQRAIEERSTKARFTTAVEAMETRAYDLSIRRTLHTTLSS